MSYLIRLVKNVSLDGIQGMDTFSVITITILSGTISAIPFLFRPVIMLIYKQYAYYVPIY